jgi:hypothetical protein
MLKALVVKELRESVGLIAVAGLASLYVLAELTGFQLLPWQRSRYDESLPFVSDSLTFYLCLVAGGLAVLLGLKQTAWELWQGTFFFLFHRPMSRRRVVATKLVVGGGLLLAVSGALVAVYALWAATPGTHASPFFWSMTGPAWQLWLSLLLLYFGGFLCGIRPGKWFGSRLAPLVASAALVMVAVTMPWWWFSLAIVLTGSVIGILSIFYYVAARDY